MLHEKGNVKEYTLGDVCQMFNGTNFKSMDVRNCGKPFVKVKDIQDGIINTDNLSYFNSDIYPNPCSLKYGDIVIVRTGRGSVGKVGINLSYEEVSFDGYIIKLEPNPNIIDKRYLYHFLSSCPEEIEKCIVEGVIHNLRKEEFKKLKVLVPSLKKQRDIAHKLDKFMELNRELNRELNLRRQQHDYHRNDIMQSLLEKSK